MGDIPDINDFARENGPDATRNKIDAADNVVNFATRQQGKGGGLGHATAPDGRQIVEIKRVALAENVKQTERILIDAGEPIVPQRHSKLVNIITLPETETITGVKRAAGAPMINVLSTATIRRGWTR